MKFLILLTTLCIALSGCSQDTLVADPSDLNPSALFLKDSVIGYSNDIRLDEISGLVTSYENPGLFWVHNDGGDDPNIYLIDRDMTIKMTVRLVNAVHYVKGEAKIDKVNNFDWEDMSKAMIDDKSFLLIGDIGDNRATRDSVMVYRFEEPRYNGDSLVNITAERMVLRYEEGPRDAETLMSDPFNGNTIILSKRDARVKYYSFAFEPISKTVKSLGEVDLTYLTGGDINRNGDILVKHYDHVYLFPNEGGRPITDVLLDSTWREVNYVIESQGEAICWGDDNTSYYTTSERRYDKPEPFYWYY